MLSLKKGKKELSIRISTWIGLSIGAKHYYIQLEGYDGEKKATTEKTEWKSLDNGLKYLWLVIQDRFTDYKILWESESVLKYKDFKKFVGNNEVKV